MTKTYQELASMMAYIANSAGGCHPEWKEGKAGEFMFEQREDVKRHLATNQVALNFSKLTDKEKQTLGFAKWDDNNDWLIPVWLFNLLPDGTPLYSPTIKVYEIKDEETDDDYRLGVTGWSFDLRKK